MAITKQKVNSGATDANLTTANTEVNYLLLISDGGHVMKVSVQTLSNYLSKFLQQ